MENEKFGKFINELRTKKGITQEQLGNMLNVSDKAVSRWERGECYPEITLLPKIAEVFLITIDELIEGVAKPKKLLRMCGGCKNQKCKKTNYSLLPHCSNSFHWVVFGIISSILFIFMSAVYLIVRIIDSKWNEWRFPVISGVIYLVMVIILALIFSLKDIKIEIKSEG